MIFSNKRSDKNIRLRSGDAGGCGCILIILGLLGVVLFGAPPGALIIIGILILIFG